MRIFSLKLYHITAFFTFFIWNGEIRTCLAEVSDKAIYQAPLGLRANDPSLDDFSKGVPDSPPLCRTGKTFVTLNMRGFDIDNILVNNKEWFIEALLKEASQVQKPILDVDARYGMLSKALLEQGAKVVYHDSEPRHLLIGRKGIAPRYYSSLYLDQRAFPHQVDYPENSLNIVIFNQCLHFYSPEDIEVAFSKAHKWLTAGGKIFISVMSPYNSSFKGWFLPHYEHQWTSGNLWPGLDLEIAKALPAQVYALSLTLHVMDDRPLKRVLIAHGFKVEQDGFIATKKIEGGAGKNIREAKDVYAIIAVKEK